VADVPQKCIEHEQAPHSICAASGNPRANSRGQCPDAGEHSVTHAPRCVAHDKSRPGTSGELQQDSESLDVCGS
jgi:hypothetical protein